MFGGTGEYIPRFVNESGAINNIRERGAAPSDSLWHYDFSQEDWESLGPAGLGSNTLSYALITFDEENQTGSWIYGGSYQDTPLHALIRFDTTTSPYPLGVVVDTIGGGSVGNRAYGEMVYLSSVGKAGILILIGGTKLGSGEYIGGPGALVSINIPLHI